VSEPQLEDATAQGIEPRCDECENRHDPDSECPHEDVDLSPWYDDER